MGGEEYLMEAYKPKMLPLDCIDWAAHVTLIGQANAALARYDGMLQSIVNPFVLLSPLTTREAVLSSRIEGTQANMEEVLRYEADSREPMEASRVADITEIINYRKAMIHAVDSLKTRPCCLNLMKELHLILLDSVRGRDKARGEFRKSQNYIGRPGEPIERASFIPPAWEDVEPSMGAWETYLHIDEKDRLVQLAIVKAQFELIHPFLDGNGRLGRMLVPIFLFEKGILSSPMFYMSEYLEKNRETYYTKLQALSLENDWNGWISFFLKGLMEQAAANTAKTRKILDLYERMKHRIPEIVRSQYVIQAIDALFDRPVFQSSDFITRSKVPRDSALRILKDLKKNELIRDIRPASGRQAAVVILHELIDIVEENG
jgi:Fic family protein